MNEELYNKGLKLVQQKDYAGAIEEFTHVLQDDPYFAEAYRQRGLAYYDSGATLQAVSDYTEAIKLNPESPEAYYCRAEARLTLKNLPGTLADVDKAISLQPNYPAAHNLRGIVQRKEGYIQSSIASFKKAAELYLAQKDKENCRQCLESIKQLQPKEYPTVVQSPPKIAPMMSEKQYFHQLLEKAEKGDTRQAIDDLNWVLQADPQDGIAYCCRGVVRCKQEKYQDAISDFNQALRLNFEDAIVYRNRGKARFQLGDHSGAIADYNLALQIQPEDALIYIARANAHRAMGDYYAAIKDYTQALQIDSNNPQAYHNRGIAYTHLEEMQQAIEDYQRAASMFCEKEDWQNYQVVLNSLKKIQSSTPEVKNAKHDLLRQRLLRMVGGYWEIAQRLIEQKKNYNPGKSEEWYLQTVIDDLERDRGR